jgi:hypothetical protein
MQAYRVEVARGSSASAVTPSLGSPILIDAQVLPLLVVFNMPPRHCSDPGPAQTLGGPEGGIAGAPRGALIGTSEEPDVAGDLLDGIDHWKSGEETLPAAYKLPVLSTAIFLTVTAPVPPM